MCVGVCVWVCECKHHTLFKVTVDILFIGCDRYILFKNQNGLNLVIQEEPISVLR